MVFTSAAGEYRITGGGAIMQANTDAFHFLWKRTWSGFTLTADVRILGTGGNKQRKACLMVRQSLAPDSAYADVALHGELFFTITPPLFIAVLQSGPFICFLPKKPANVTELLE